jgi:hypothetical protein
MQLSHNEGPNNGCLYGWNRALTITRLCHCREDYVRLVQLDTLVLNLILPRLCQIKTCVFSQSSAIGPLVVGEPVRACSSVG